VRLCIFFPSKSKVDISRKEFIYEKRLLRNSLIKYFGGVTEYKSKGGWLNGKGEIEEDITVFEVYITKSFFEGKGTRRKLNSTLNFIKGVLGQDAIAYSIDNEIHFISEDLPKWNLPFG